MSTADIAISLIMIVFGLLALRLQLESVTEPIRFKKTFGFPRNFDGHIKTLLQAKVDKVLTSLAQELYQHNRDEAVLLGNAKRGLIPPEEAARDYPKVRARAKKYYEKFRVARQLAHGAGFDTRTYTEYIGLVSGEEPNE